MKSITKVMSKQGLAQSTVLVVVISILLVFPRVIQLKRHLHMARVMFLALMFPSIRVKSIGVK